jgi:hypothetical protein
MPELVRRPGLPENLTTACILEEPEDPYRAPAAQPHRHPRDSEAAPLARGETHDQPDHDPEREKDHQEPVDMSAAEQHEDQPRREPEHRTGRMSRDAQRRLILHMA